MSETQAIVIGMLGAGALMAYYAFKLNESRDPILRTLSVLFFNFSFSTVIGLFWLASQIAENAPITYLQVGLVPYITGSVWIFIFVLVMFFLRFFYMLFGLLHQWFLRVTGLPAKGPNPVTRKNH